MKTEKILSLVLFVAMLGLSAWGHFHLPDGPVPIHYGLHGEVNGTLPRDKALIFMPVMALAMSVLFFWLLPAIMPKSVSPERFTATYGAVMLTVIVLFAGLHVMLVLSAAGLAMDHVRVITIGLGALFVVMGNLLPKTRLNYLMGIRTPWTISDERVWDKTHRFAGPLFVLGGFVAMAGAFLPEASARFAVLIAAISLPAVVSIAYSYLVSRALKLTP